MMPILLFILGYRSGISKNRLICYALFSSWFGDIFLMVQRFNLVSGNASFFILGLSSFLLAHLLYSVCFLKEISRQNKVSVIVEQPYLIVPFLVFLIVYLSCLSPYLGIMKLPVYIYAVCIVAMLVLSLNRLHLVRKQSFILTFSGALLFVLSDTVLSIVMFCKQSLLLGVIVMLTYGLAQLFIVLGRDKVYFSVD